MELDECVNLIAASPACVLHPPAGMPDIPPPLILPDDVRMFYERAGGAILFRDEPYDIEIVRPEDFVRGNPEILQDPAEYDISHNWFIVAKSEPQYITIDLAPGRLGRCYDSFWETHALRGDTAIIARSFTELLVHLLKAEGQGLYWLADDFESRGDAYDGVPE